MSNVNEWNFLRPKNHKDAAFISLQNIKEIKKCYSEILGIHRIDHFSINIADPEGETVYLSSTPSMAYNLCASDLWKYDASLSPSFYKKKDFYFWKEGYHPARMTDLILVKELMNGFSEGCMIPKKIADFYIVYSFGTRAKDLEISELLQNSRLELEKMGDHAFSSIRSIYQNYCEKHSIPLL